MHYNIIWLLVQQHTLRIESMVDTVWAELFPAIEGYNVSLSEALLVVVIRPITTSSVLWLVR